MEVLHLADGRHQVGMLSLSAWVVTPDESGHYMDLSTSQSLVIVLETVPSVFFANLERRFEELNLRQSWLILFQQ